MMNATTLRPDQPVKIKVDGQIVEATFAEHYRDNYGVFNYNGRRYTRAYNRLERHNVGSTNSQIEIPLVQSTATELVTPATALVPSTPAEPEVYYDVNERFNFIDRMVDMIVRGFEKSLVITGSGGLGKSYTVFNRLKQNDLGDADFVKVSGHMTPKALFRRLHDENGKLVVFDDCDAILGHETSINLLKASLDSYGQRRVSWCTELGTRDDLPGSFDFTGRVIFISNYKLQDFPQPVLSRALYVDVTMTADEKIDRIKTIAPSLVPDLDEIERNECIELLSQLRHKVSDLNFRTLLKVASIRRAQPLHWRAMSRYMVTAKLNSTRR